MSDNNVIRIRVERTSDPAENKERARAALEYGIKAAASDPGVLIRMSLGRAYSDLHTNGLTRTQVVEQLRNLLADEPLHGAAWIYHANLTSVVRARTNGDRCGDYIGRFQLELLTEVLNPITEDPPDAA